MNEEQYVKGVRGGKRLSLIWTPWMGDWFVSASPRNGSSHAEGPWAHWVDLALTILRHPYTKKVRPELHEAVNGFEPRGFYDEVDVSLTDDDLTTREETEA